MGNLGIEIVVGDKMASQKLPRRAAVSLVRTGNWVIYADGFKRAAEILDENIRTTLEVNTCVFPLLFLYRHYIELSLKEIIGYGLCLEGKRAIPPLGHSLMGLWGGAKGHIRSHLVPALFSERKLKEIETLIRAVDQIDPESERSRYPIIGKKKGALEYSFSFNAQHLDLDNLKDKVEKISGFLKEAANILSITVDEHREQENEDQEHFESQ